MNNGRRYSLCPDSIDRRQTVPVPRDLIADFQAELCTQGHRGDCHTDPATRSVMVTDNSVYEVMPQAVVYPAEPDDVNRILHAAAVCGIPLCERVGGAG